MDRIKDRDVNEVLAHAIFKASAALRGAGHPATDAVLDEFDSKVDEVAELARARVKQSEKG